VRHANVSGGVFSFHKGLKVRNLAFTFIYPDIVVQQADPGTVVTTVLKPVQSLNQDRIGFPGSDIRNNSAHSFFVYVLNNAVN
jgi:hypothetical protein